MQILPIWKIVFVIDFPENSPIPGYLLVFFVTRLHYTHYSSNVDSLPVSHLDPQFKRASLHLSGHGWAAMSLVQVVIVEFELSLYTMSVVDSCMKTGCGSYYPLPSPVSHVKEQIPPSFLLWCQSYWGW